MSWFAFSLCSVSALAIAELVQQHLLNRARKLDESISAVLTFLFQSVLALLVIFSCGLSPNLTSVLHPTTIPWLAAVGLLASFAMVFYLRSFRVESISISCIFVSWSAVVSSALGVIFFAESLQASKIAGIFLVLAAVAILNLKNARLERNHINGLVAGALFGFIYTLDKKIVLQSSPIIYMFWVFLLVAVLGTATNPRRVIGGMRYLEAGDLKRMMISGLAYFLFNLCTFSAYAYGGEVGRIDAINNSQVFIIILVEYLVFRQRQGVGRKLTCASLAAVGVALLGAGVP